MKQSIIEEAIRRLHQWQKKQRKRNRLKNRSR